MSRQDRANVFLDVDLKIPDPPINEEEVLDMSPPEPPPKPTEKDIFKKPDLVLEKPTIKRKADRKTDQKRTVTPKMRAHLDRIRTKASESKKKKACEKNGLEYIPPPQIEETIPEPIVRQVQESPIMPTIPEESVNSVNESRSGSDIDYDRIVNGLWSRQQKYNDEQKYMSEIRDKIRKEEREKAFKESSTLFQSAAVKYKKATEAKLGNNVLFNYQNKYQGHPVFGLKKNNNGNYQTNGSTDNPFDSCFK